MTDTVSECWAELAALFDSLVDLPTTEPEVERARSLIDAAVPSQERKLLAALVREPAFPQHSPSLEQEEAGHGSFMVR